MEEIYTGHTKEQLEQVCKCGHTRRGHTVKDTYCFQFSDNNNPCNCKKFALGENHDD